MIKIDITIDTVRPALDRLALASTDLSPLVRQISEEMTGAVEENFEKEGRPLWAQLSAVKVEQRGNTGPILQRSGLLAASVVAAHDAHSAIAGTTCCKGQLSSSEQRKADSAGTPGSVACASSAWRTSAAPCSLRKRG